MNPQHPDHPDLTAYALGELPHEQEREMRDWIATSPDAQAELARIEQISEALHHSAPIPGLKLTPQQRQYVLTPPKGPRIMTPMMPRQPMARKQSRFSPFLMSVTRIAAAVAVACTAFMLGKHFGSPVVSPVASTNTPEPKAEPAPSTVVAPPLKSTPVKTEPLVASTENKPSAPSVPVAAPVVAPKTEQAPTAAAVVVAPAPTPTKPAVAPKASPSAPPTDLRGYASVSRDPVSKVVIRPHDTRPAPVKVKGEALASPISPNAAALAAATTDKGRAPELAIQSWKAEVATCPWNSNHKLMRVLVQLPADQPASVSAANAYPLQVGFDNLTVRSYRLLSQSHVPPHPGTNNAAHVMWYEVIPNGAVTDASRETGRPVATISVQNAHFDSKAVGPFDSKDTRNLRALDRGAKWENAREDFLFETAIVGFGLLLRGEENLGSLNHELVLKLAKHAQGEKEVEGERAKFIRLVQEAKRMTGI